MQKLYSSDQSKQMDINAQQSFSIPGATLMEDASFSAFQMIRDDLESSRKTVFLAGGGNNGGDALAMARLAYLDGLRNIQILLSDSGKETDLRAVQRKACEAIGISFAKSEDEALDGAELLVDGLFGIGLKGAPRLSYQCLISKINEKKIDVISLDVPSGMGDSVPIGCSLKARRTICMGERKAALYIPKNRDLSGEIETTFPFFPISSKPDSDIALLSEGDIAIRGFKGDDYKKTRGSVAIIGGSGRFTGAVVLSAKAAFHCGAGLVTIFTEPALIPSISKAIPSAMVTTYDDISDLTSFDAVLVGPGMGKDHDKALSMALSQARRLVVDADGIRAFARIKARAEGQCILTPHLGEYSALVKAFCPDSEEGTPQAWIDTLKKVQTETNAQIVLKANTVWVCSEEGLNVIDGQNPSLGVAGSGDVLSGIITALSGSGNVKPATNGALLHQKAGILAHRELGMYSSDDLVKFIGRSL